MMRPIHRDNTKLEETLSSGGSVGALLFPGGSVTIGDSVISRGTASVAGGSVTIGVSVT